MSPSKLPTSIPVVTVPPRTPGRLSEVARSRERSTLGAPPTADAPHPGQGLGGKRGPRPGKRNAGGNGKRAVAGPGQAMVEAFDLPPAAADDDGDLSGRTDARVKFRSMMKNEDREAIFAAMMTQAKGGHVQAAALLMAYDLGKPTQPQEQKDVTPISGAKIGAAIEAALENARNAGVDMRLIEQGVWGPRAAG